jgi:hypothetical protein
MHEHGFTLLFAQEVDQGAIAIRVAMAPLHFRTRVVYKLSTLFERAFCSTRSVHARSQKTSHMNLSDLPQSPLERAHMLQNVLLARATGGDADAGYQLLRRQFVDGPITKQLLPQFVRTSRDLSQFWAYIKYAAPTYQGRRELIYEAFQPLHSLRLPSSLRSRGASLFVSSIRNIRLRTT